MGFTPDTASLDNYYDRGKVLLAWRVSVAFFLIFAVLTAIYAASSSSTALLPTSLVLVVSGSCAIYLRATLNYKPVFWVYAVAGTLLSNLALNYVLDMTHYVDFMWITTCILLAFIGLGWVYGICFIILNAVGVACFFGFTLNTHIQVLVPKTNVQLIGDFVEVLFAFFVIAYLMRQFILFQTHSEESLRKANANLEDQNKLIRSKSDENETLMKEIHHRVKNNLQIIISLLRIQSAELKTEESRNQFQEAINRIMAMSLIHEKLYGEKELSKINIKSYLEELVGEIESVFQRDGQLDLSIKTQLMTMNIDTIVPLGLLVNELVSNSFKHAFDNEATRAISMEIEQTSAGIEFVYSDSGSWKTPVDGRTSFGLELIDILTDQLNGEKKLDTTNGTCYHFTLRDTTLA